jgi:hypothetical protein
METLIRVALKDFDTFKELTETIPLEVLEAEATGLSKSQQQLFQEYSLRLTAPTAHDQAQQPPLQIGDTVQYMNPDKLENCCQFEGIDLTIDHIWRTGGDGSGDLALCRMPDGTQKTFGLRTLR